jgi:hypothetical protein
VWIRWDESHYHHCWMKKMVCMLDKKRIPLCCHLEPGRTTEPANEPSNRVLLAHAPGHSFPNLHGSCITSSSTHAPPPAPDPTSPTPPPGHPGRGPAEPPASAPALPAHRPCHQRQRRPCSPTRSASTAPALSPSARHCSPLVQAA